MDHTCQATVDSETVWTHSESSPGVQCPASQASLGNVDASVTPNSWVLRASENQCHAVEAGSG